MTSAPKPTHWADIQQMTFTRWMNEHLKDRGMRCDDLSKDLSNGLLLVNLMEIISGKPIGKYNKHPKIPQQKSENCEIVVNFIKSEGIPLVNIGGKDIFDNKLKLILGLLWTLILRYEINKGGSDGENDLLKWVQSKIPEYGITNFTSDWNSGKAICGLVDALRPGFIPNHMALDAKNNRANAERGITTAEDRMAVAPLITPDEMINPRVDKQAMMTYIVQFRNLQDYDESHLCSAYGSGLVDGVVNEQQGFLVTAPPHGKGKIAVKVEGPSSEAKVEIKQDGYKYDVKYMPKEVGMYRIHVTYDGKHIPGSIFTVIIREYESLGGEGKIIVFFSTTSSSEKGRQDVFNLQTMLEAKRIHERPDFEPFIPVDIMDRADREAVFKRAGTRNLPIIFVDDIYVGDYDTLCDANEAGKLDKLLKTTSTSLYERDQEKLKKWKGGVTSGVQGLSISGTVPKK